MTDPTTPAPEPPAPRGETPGNRLYVAAAAGVLIGVALGSVITRLQISLKGGPGGPCPECLQRQANDAIAQARLRQMMMDQATEPPAPASEAQPSAAGAPSGNSSPTWAEARPNAPGE